MNTVLLRFSVKGVKNLSNNTSIDFYKKTIRKNSVIDLKNRRIKARNFFNIYENTKFNNI